MEKNYTIVPVEDFVNKICKEIDSTYFPNVKYYRDNKQCETIHYAIECFSNGVLPYNTFITLLSKNTKETKPMMHDIVSKFIVTFNDFKYLT